MDSLFIVSSPFQALCANEAVYSFSEETPFYLVLDSNCGANALKRILPEDRILAVVEEGRGMRHLLSALGMIDRRFDRIYVGDYFSYSQLIVESVLASYKAHVTFLDDGNSTLKLAPPVSAKRFAGFKKVLRALPFLFMEKIKFLKRRFFSIYDLNGLKLPVVKNRLEHLVSEFRAIPQKDIYIIGTNSSILKFNKKDYKKYLSDIAAYSALNFPGETVYYCPHRRDANDYSDLCHESGMQVFNTEMSVEIDFSMKGIHPRMVIGFGSTAMLTLKLMFPDSECVSISVWTSDNRINDSYRSVEAYLMKYGVNVVDDIDEKGIVTL